MTASGATPTQPTGTSAAEAAAAWLRARIQHADEELARQLAGPDEELAATHISAIIRLKPLPDGHPSIYEPGVEVTPDQLRALLDEREQLHVALKLEREAFDRRGAVVHQVRSELHGAWKERDTAIARAVQAEAERDQAGAELAALTPLRCEYSTARDGATPDHGAMTLASALALRAEDPPLHGAVLKRRVFAGPWVVFDGSGPGDTAPVDGPGASESAPEPSHVQFSDRDAGGVPEGPYASGGFISAEQGAAIAAELAAGHGCWPFGWSLPSQAEIEAREALPGIPDDPDEIRRRVEELRAAKSVRSTSTEGST